MDHLLAIVFIVVVGGIGLLIEYLIHRGISGTINRLHFRSKQYLDTQGRFRLADRYSSVPLTPPAESGDQTADLAQTAPTVTKAENAMPGGEDALPENNREPEQSLTDSEWELEEETPPAPAPQPQPRPAPKPQLSDGEWELEEETPPAPASQPQPRPAPRPEPVPAPSPARRTVEAKNAAKPRASAPVPESTLPTFDIPDTIPPFQEDRCCICNGELGGKFAVLFKAESGAEARIDRDCAMKFNTLIQSGDPLEIVGAARAMMARCEAVDPKVKPYIRKYVKAAADRLKQQTESSGK